MFIKRSLIAFTLAEVLITLTIIGVVAALTIPNLIARQEEQATIAALKKAYSTLSDAYTLAVQENGTPDNWGLVVGNSPPILGNLVPYLKVDKNCLDGSSGCWPSGVTYMNLAPSLGGYANLDSMANRPKLRLVDGIMLIGYVDNATCSADYGTSAALDFVCGRYLVDINGYSKPNTIGKDTFQFWITKNGIVPFGTAQDTQSPFVDGCKNKNTQGGHSCAAWVIYNENMDYLRCNDIDWNGKRKCG